MTQLQENAHTKGRTEGWKDGRKDGRTEGLKDVQKSLVEVSYVDPRDSQI